MEGHPRIKNSHRYRQLFKKIAIKLSVTFKNEKLDYLSFLLYLAGPLLMLLSLFMFRSCLLNQIYLFHGKSLQDPIHETTRLSISEDE
jgi:hypothetical protein